MAQHRERQLVRCHADAVVGDLDPLDAAAIQRHRDPGGAGVERVLDQLLHRCGRALDHLARGDAVHGRRGKEADARHDRACIGHPPRHAQRFDCPGAAHGIVHRHGRFGATAERVARPVRQRQSARPFLQEDPA